MNVSDLVRVSDLVPMVLSSNMPQREKSILALMLGRVDKLAVDLIVQLKAEPTIFTVDPDTETEDVEGAKAGDIAIYDDGGTTTTKRYDGTSWS